MACVYCMPVGYQGSPRDQILTFEEMVRVGAAFHAVGVHTIRLTGGEPLLRKNMVALCQALTDRMPGLDLALTTNASLLVRHAVALRNAGLARINISVDSVRPEVFEALTRGGRLADVLAGVDAALSAGFTELKTNTVVMRSRNLDQVQEVARWALGLGLTPRFIELMPLGEGASQMADHVGWEEIRDALGPLVLAGNAHRPEHRGPAFYLPAAGGGRVGFITAVSNAFCDVCDRVRLTAKGEIRACLASPDGMSLRDVLRSGATDAQLVEALRAALAGKTQHAFSEDGHGQAPQVTMTGIGG